MRKCIAAALLSAILGLTVLGCGTKIEPTPEPPEPEYTVAEGIRDSKYENGFNLRGLDSKTDSGIVKVIDYGDSSKTPVWGAAQWWSKTSLAGGTETVTANEYSLKDASKTLAVNRKYGSLTLGLDASAEFDSYNIVPPAKWPHLLVEQNLAQNLKLKDAEKVMANLDFTLTKGENKRGGSVGLQAQFAWFIYVVDQNPNSPGYGNFLWFGFNIYDSTKLYAPGTSMQDTAGGLGNYIYTLGAADYLSDRVKVGQNVKFSLDVLPWIKKGVESAQKAGFMSGTKVEDCLLTGMNIGWEVFDRWDVSVTLFDMGIDVYYPKEG